MNERVDERHTDDVIVLCTWRTTTTRDDSLNVVCRSYRVPQMMICITRATSLGLHAQFLAVRPK